MTVVSYLVLVTFSWFCDGFLSFVTAHAREGEGWRDGRKEAVWCVCEEMSDTGKRGRGVCVRR